MTQKVFLAYSHVDRNIAIKLESELRKYGISVLDVQELDQKSVRDRIRERIAQSDFLIALWTSHATSNWVSYEMGLANGLGKSVAVFAPRSYSVRDLPIDFVGWPIYSFELATIGETVRTFVSRLESAA